MQNDKALNHVVNCFKSVLKSRGRNNLAIFVLSENNLVTDSGLIHCDHLFIDLVIWLGVIRQ